jgi:hypothetical protein
MKVSDVYPSQWLRAADIEDPIRETIKSVTMEEIVQGESKAVMHFMGHTKPLVLNKSKSNAIAAVYGDDTDAWTGKQIKLIRTQVLYQGKMVDSIGVILPKAQLAPVPDPAKAAEPDDVPF